jgi:catechol 2,3-dioxygenase-like lactoylglutathione lyase family enzyme
MRITHLTIPSSDPEACLAFYRDVLQLPVVGAVVRVGWTRIEVVEEGIRFPDGDIGASAAAADDGRAIHLAFNIPPQRFEAACKWLARRALILRDPSGEERFRLEGVWQSRSIYFAGPHDAVLELIARDALLSPCAAEGDFHGREMLCVSEVGLPTGDVLEVAKQLTSDLGIEAFGEVSEDFSPLGDDEGLLILVKKKRPWFPEGRLLPEALGVRVRFHVRKEVISVDA